MKTDSAGGRSGGGEAPSGPAAVRAIVEGHLEGAVRAVAALSAQAEAVARAAAALGAALRGGGTLYTCGNGGSAAEAMHLAEELIGCYRAHDRGARPALCLNADAAALTCIANDFGYENLFARQCEALVKKGDVLVGLSTSGGSENVALGLETARRLGATTIGLLGRGGGRCRALCDHPIVVEGRCPAHIQEAHLVIIHVFCEMLEPPRAEG